MITLSLIIRISCLNQISLLPPKRSSLPALQISPFFPPRAASEHIRNSSMAVQDRALHLFGAFNLQMCSTSNHPSPAWVRGPPRKRFKIRPEKIGVSQQASIGENPAKVEGCQIDTNQATEFVAETLLPTKYGKLRLRGYRDRVG